MSDNVFPRADRGETSKLGPQCDLLSIDFHCFTTVLRLNWVYFMSSNDGAPTELMAVTNLSEVRTQRTHPPHLDSEGRLSAIFTKLDQDCLWLQVGVRSGGFTIWPTSPQREYTSNLSLSLEGYS